jgi:hypothetical protein
MAVRKWEEGKRTLLSYDAKGSLKKRTEMDWGQIELSKGSHTLQVSCGFDSKGDLQLEGVVKLKDKVDVIHL